MNQTMGVISCPHLSHALVPGHIGLRFCKKQSVCEQDAWQYDWGCYLSDLKAAGDGRSALELCAPLPSERGALHLVCT